MYYKSFVGLYKISLGLMYVYVNYILKWRKSHQNYIKLDVVLFKSRAELYYIESTANIICLQSFSFPVNFRRAAVILACATRARTNLI